MAYTVTVFSAEICNTNVQSHSHLLPLLWSMQTKSYVLHVELHVCFVFRLFKCQWYSVFWWPVFDTLMIFHHKDKIHPLTLHVQFVKMIRRNFYMKPVPIGQDACTKVEIITLYKLHCVYLMNYCMTFCHLLICAGYWRQGGHLLKGSVAAVQSPVQMVVSRLLSTGPSLTARLLSGTISTARPAWVVSLAAFTLASFTL